MPMHRPSLLLTVLLCGAGVGLCFAPQRLTSLLRSGLRDALGPGQRLALAAGDRTERMVQKLRQVDDRSEEIAALQEQAARRKWRIRQLELRGARLQRELDELQATFAPSAPARAEAPLLVAELQPATVLGRESAALWRSGILLDRGTAGGLRETSLVLDDPRPLIDRGADGGLKNGLPVYAGRIVIGKIAEAGRFSSTVQPVTDEDYRGGARLARIVDGELRFGAAGILAGRGDGRCELQRIDSTEPVGVGDEVYTDNTDGLFPYAMYYGRVVKAEPKPGFPWWEIEIEPAANELQPRRVQVLLKEVNPLRVAAHEQGDGE